MLLSFKLTCVLMSISGRLLAQPENSVLKAYMVSRWDPNNCGSAPAAPAAPALRGQVTGGAFNQLPPQMKLHNQPSAGVVGSYVMQGINVEEIRRGLARDEIYIKDARQGLTA